MTTETAVPDTAVGETGADQHDDAQTHEGHGLPFSGVIKIAVLLAVLTGIEVLTYFIDFGDVATPLLLVLMVVKFSIVVAYFMHLRFDNPLFTLLFMIGIVVAIGVYIAVLATFEFF